MKKFKVRNNGKEYVVKAADSESAVVTAMKLRDGRVNVGCAEIQVNEKYKAYSVGSVKYFNQPWDENTFRKYAQECIAVANKLKELRSKGYSEDVIKAYERDSAIDDCGGTEIQDSSKLADLAYKLGQMANYFDRANSAISRKFLGRDDEAKKAEFYKLGVQTYTQLKFEVEQMEKAGKTGNEYYWGDKGEIVSLLDDASNRMFWLDDKRFKVLHEKFEPLIRKYEKLTRK